MFPSSFPQGSNFAHTSASEFSEVVFSLSKQVNIYEAQFLLVKIPEFADRVVIPCTHGKTREEAIRNGEEAIDIKSGRV